jgi:hypothetical protein
MKVIEKLAKESGAAPKVWKYIAKEAATTAGSEGLTEAAQETINAAAERVAGSAKGILDPENIQRYKESFVKGAIGGGAFGTVSGTSQGLTARKDFLVPKKPKKHSKRKWMPRLKPVLLRQRNKLSTTLHLRKHVSNVKQSLTSTFKNVPEDVGAVSLAALQQRADAIKEQNPGAYDRIYGELDAAIAARKANDAEAEAQATAKANQELTQAETEYNEGMRNKQAGSAFAEETPTPGTGGMFKPALEEKRVEKAITQETTVTPNLLRGLRIPPNSLLTPKLKGLDLTDRNGIRRFVQVIESPKNMVNINDDVYTGILDKLYADGYGAEIDAARQEMQVEDISDTKQGQQEQTRQFAFGVPDVTRPDTTPSGGGAGMAGKSTTKTTTADETTVGGGDVSTQQDATDATGREGQQSTTLTEGTTTDGTTTTQTQQAEAQRQAATTTPRGILDRPDLSSELPTIQQKLGGEISKLDKQSKDARAYFGKVIPELALDAIANDLVLAPTAYRNSKKKLPSVLTPGAFALTPEPTFGTKEEAAFYQGQGGIHTKNAAAWARANLSPKAVAFMDQKIAQYTKEKAESIKTRKKQQKEQDIRKGTETQVKEESKTAKAEGEFAPTLEELEDAKGTKTLAGKRKKDLQRLARELESDLYGGLDDNADTDLSGLLADADLAALHTQAHPVVLQQLADNNLVSALEMLSESGSSKTAERFAEALSKRVGNVNLVYGAEKSMYDPKTNTDLLA